jgi:deoxyadenosine/deoxycytidine kinase
LEEKSSESRREKKEMLIGFTGAQSTGKSTLLEACCMHEKFRKYHCIREVTRKVKREHKVNINEAGGDATQLFILAEHLYNHCLTNNTILDRCIVDGLIYTQYLYENNQVSKWVLDYAKELHDMLITKLDFVFYTEPEDIPVVNDGERSTNIKFRNDIISLYEKYMQEYPSVFTRLNGSVSDRLETILKQTKL